MGKQQTTPDIQPMTRPWQPLLLVLCISLLLPYAVRASGEWTGRHLMQEVAKRHENYPYIFERQSMIMQDKAGNRDVRQLRRFSRLEADGRMNYLLVFDQPAEIRGVTLLATRQAKGQISNGIYLPAFGPQMKSGRGESRNTPFLGTDFSIQDLTPEIMADFDYRRKGDVKIGKVKHYVVDAYPRTANIEKATGYSRRRLFIRQDNFFVVRTDFYDRQGRLYKRRTQHDLKQVDGPMWRADMVLMQDFHEHHLSLIKIEQRVFSKDYVPAEIFTPDYILANRLVSRQMDNTPDNAMDALKRIEFEDEIPDNGLLR